MKQKNIHNYITPRGAKKLREELRHLWRKERPEWTERVSAAAKEGDRSENAEYIYGKKKLRELDRRIRYLTKTLDTCDVVYDIPNDEEKIFFGAFVSLEDENGNKQSIQIVGTAEFDLKMGRISILSPLAKALIGKTMGDEVSVLVDGQSTYFEVTRVIYQEDLSL